MARGAGTIAFAFVRVASGRIVPGTDEYEQLLRGSLIAGLPVTRYGRLWRVGRTTRHGNALMGRLGYDRVGQTEGWDEARRDFTSRSVPEGRSSPFALDMEGGRVAFQVRGEEIKIDTFQWNFQGVLNAGVREQGYRGVRWRVRKQLHLETLSEFLGRSRRVDQMAFNLKPPNPGYKGRRQVEHLVAETNAGMVNVVLTAPKDTLAGLDIDAAFVKQARAHAEKYGTTRVTADVRDPDGTVQTEKWRSQMEGTPLTTKAPATGRSGQVSREALQSALEETQVPEPAADDDDD